MKTLKPVDMAVETALLKSMTIRANYEQYVHYVDIKKVLPTTQLLLRDYAKYYNLYQEHSNIDLGKFYTHFAQNWHKNDLEVHEIEYYRDYVLPAISNCVEQEVEKCLLGLIEKQVSENLVESINVGLDITEIREKLDWIEQKQSQINGNNDKDIVTINTAKFEVLDKQHGVPWFLPSLRRSLLSITLGQFIVISADFGTGKTAFCIGQVVITLKWLKKNNDKRPILYINSEGTAEDVFARVLSNMYQRELPEGFEEVVENIEETKEKYISMYGEYSLIVIQMSTVSTYEAIKAKIKKYKPCLTIIDICDKLAKEEDVQSLKKLYDNLRVLSADVCPIIGTSQSGDTTYWDKNTNEKKQVKWLDDHMLYGSKAGKGGAADTIITIGRESDRSPIRYVNVVKKKRGEPCKITCELQNQYSYYRELEY